ncbi:GAF and ANTAR domain-containing protein [Nocardioides panacisoli]|uniref:GAF and ANTAR domain-containing protein n=1 Tax=Nocardioides panacisoli TaxID=627624 RepID=UPI001C62C6FA|nr:GAF and ANTAR domain-containing protein [Nocardioides panacisoli]QYJ02807.1 GAF and ANTAR domain-containing protein [Nocardioides panacisoli]
MSDAESLSSAGADEGRPVESSAVFAALADLVYAPDDVEHIYQELCRAAPLVIAGCDHASLMLRQGDRFVTAAASDEIARRIDRAEMELDDGPCVDAITEEAAQVDGDLRHASEWPELAEWILEHTPVRGAMAFRIVIDDRKVGALNLFSDTPDALVDSVDEAAVFAAFASVTASAAHHNERAMTLREGLDSNREIGKAVGLLMAFHKVSDDAAFQMLRKTSQDLNIKLSEVARELIDYHRDR